MPELINLPAVLLSSLVSSWLTVKSVARLDSALCSKSHREDILQTAYTATAGLQYDSGYFMWDASCDGMISWILAKDVPMRGIYATPTFLESSCRRKKYLKKHGDSIKWAIFGPELRPNKKYAHHRPAAIDVAQYCPNLTNFDGMHFFNDAVVMKLAQCCPLLEKLHGSANDCTDKAVLELAKHCSKLKDVYFPSGHLDEKSVIALVRSNPGLVELTVGAESFSDDLLRALATGCPKLECISIYCVAHVTLEAVLSLMKECKNLKDFSVEFMTFLPADDDPEPVSNTSMRVLSLVDCSIVDEDLHDLVRACPGLTKIEIRDCQGLRNLEYLPIGTHCPCLESLVLRANMVFSSDEMLLDLSAHCPRLGILEVPDSIIITDVGVIALAEKCPLLTELDFNCCNRITDASLLALAQQCKLLEVLILFECSEITKVGVEAVMQGCAELVELGVEQCSKLTPRFIKSVQKRYPETQDILDDIYDI